MKKKDEIRVSVDHVWNGCCGGQWCFMWINHYPVLAWEYDTE